MADLKDKFINTRKNSNALQFLNSLVLKLYEIRRHK